MFRLVLQTLRLRKAGFLASFVALLFGAVIVMACGGLLETGIRTTVHPQRLAAAPVIVTADQSNPSRNKTLPERARLAADAAVRVRAVAGVTAVHPDVSFPVAAMTRYGTVGAQTVGHGWSSAALAPYRLVRGVAPTGSDQVVLDQALATRLNSSVGDDVSLLVRGARQQFRVSGVAAGAVEATAMFFDDGEAATLFGPPGVVDSFGVFLAPGADPAHVGDDIERALVDTPAVVLLGDDRGTAEFPEVLSAGGRLIPVAAVTGGIAALVTVFVVGSTLALLLRQRRRELALLRAIGVTPRQLRRMLLGESMAVGVLAVALAAVPGSLLGSWLLGRLAAAGVVSPLIVYEQHWIPTVSSAAIGLGTAFVATAVAARGSALARPVEALSEAELPRRWLSPTRLVFAVLTLAGATALALVTALVMTGSVAASTAGPSAMLWAAGVALLAPGVTRVVLAVLLPLARGMFGLPGHLAAVNSRTGRIRVAGAVTPVMLATGLAIALIYLQTSSTAVAQRVYAESLRADAVVTSTAGGFPPELVGRIAGTPGVGAASAFVTSTGYLDRPMDPGSRTKRLSVNEIPVQGVDADAAAELTAFTPSGGTLTALRGDSVALPEDQARQVKAGLGDTVTMQLGDGSAHRLKVVALFPTAKGFPTALVPEPLLVAHTTAGLATRILVRAAPGTEPAQVVARLDELVARQPGVQVADRAAITASFAEQQQTGAWVNYLMAAMIVGYALISLVNTTVVATAERRREFALQRLTGFTSPQVLRMMAVEAGVIAVAGVLLGTAVAAATLVPFGLALSGSPWPSGSPAIYVVIIVVAVALTMATTLVPAGLCLRARPVDAAAD
ncbi:ABC transporter permease [Kutzneria buriramensis]|uniref:Putative ABC transport system permease protein n=1 Tax=Kutzneria buriramensis TaxID=1045776 RepID=A0A3E0HPN2_9PSEU|nr:ABC transporter permease [Kutzneria buriramensis]REH48502.1 putative ABC transport system permease protein [Kutzneria buriramensis]